MTIRSTIYCALGLVNVFLGVLGIITPLLPTTPFLLLAAYFFARSNERLHRWLLNQRHLGPYIHAFRNKSGLTRAQKIRIGLSFSFAMGISLYFLPHLYGRIAITSLWAFWLCMLTFVMKTATEPKTTHDI